MNPNIEILKITNKTVLVIHRVEPQFKAKIIKDTTEISDLKVFSNGYLTKELNALLEEAKTFIKSLKFA